MLETEVAGVKRARRGLWSAVDARKQGGQGRFPRQEPLGSESLNQTEQKSLLHVVTSCGCCVCRTSKNSKDDSDRSQAGQEGKRQEGTGQRRFLCGQGLTARPRTVP